METEDGSVVLATRVAPPDDVDREALATPDQAVLCGSFIGSTTTVAVVLTSRVVEPTRNRWRKGLHQLGRGVEQLRWDESRRGALGAAPRRRLRPYKGDAPDGKISLSRVLTPQLMKLYAGRLDASSPSTSIIHGAERRLCLLAVLACRVPHGITILARRRLLSQAMAETAFAHLVIAHMSPIHHEYTAAIDDAAHNVLCEYENLKYRGVEQDVLRKIARKEVEMSRVTVTEAKEVVGILDASLLKRRKNVSLGGPKNDGEVELVSEKDGANWNTDPETLARSSTSRGTTRPPRPRPRPRTRPPRPRPRGGGRSRGRRRSRRDPRAVQRHSAPRCAAVHLRLSGHSAGVKRKLAVDTARVRLTMAKQKRRPAATSSTAVETASVKVKAPDGNEYTIDPWPRDGGTPRHHNQQAGYVFVDYILRKSTEVSHEQKTILVKLLRHFLHPAEVDTSWGTVPRQAHNRRDAQPRRAPDRRRRSRLQTARRSRQRGALVLRARASRARRPPTPRCRRPAGVDRGARPRATHSTMAAKSAPRAAHPRRAGVRAARTQRQRGLHQLGRAARTLRDRRALRKVAARARLSARRDGAAPRDAALRRPRRRRRRAAGGQRRSDANRRPRQQRRRLRNLGHAERPARGAAGGRRSARADWLARRHSRRATSIPPSGEKVPSPAPKSRRVGECAC